MNEASVLVVGAGITGLCAGLALAKEGHQVTLIERDAPPPSGDPDEAFFEWNRRGAAQFRHPHAFLAVMSNLLEESFPDLIEDFFTAGARKVSFEDMLPPTLKETYVPEPGDEKMWLLMCRRATMETVFRRYAEAQNNLTIQSDTNVTGLLTREQQGQIVVEGLTVQRRSETEEDLHADLVIDAGGRNSKLKDWLRALGAKIRTEDDDAEIVYYTRHYQLKPGVEEPPRDSENRSTGDLGYIKFGVFPGEGGHFAVIVCLHNDETELREAVKSPERFDQICRSIPGLNPWIAEDRAVATTPSFGFGDIHAVWHHYVDEDQPAALNYFAVGDAAVRTNPLYGRGCSTGIIHAHVLVDLIQREQDPLKRALEFDRLTEEELRPIFNASLADDKRAIKRALAVIRGEPREETGGVGRYLRAAFGDALAAASRSDIRVMRGAMRTFNLMEKPGTFMKDPRVILSTLRFMLRGRGRNKGSRKVNGPDRQEILALIRSEPADSEAA